VAADQLSNKTTATFNLSADAGEPVTAAIYQLDGLTRRSPALQATADAKAGDKAGILEGVAA
jgi:NADH-quinone oxidoreductase subunit G